MKSFPRKRPGAGSVVECNYYVCRSLYLFGNINRATLYVGRDEALAHDVCIFMKTGSPFGAC